MSRPPISSTQCNRLENLQPFKRSVASQLDLAVKRPPALTLCDACPQAQKCGDITTPRGQASPNGFRATVTFSCRLSCALVFRLTWSREPAAFAAWCSQLLEQKLGFRSSPYRLR